jgi:hypothetical protein
VLLQQRNEFLFKRHSAVVLFLISDVPDNGCNIRLAHPEAAIPCCQAKLPISRDIQRDEFALISLIASATMSVGGNCSNI